MFASKLWWKNATKNAASITSVAALVAALETRQPKTALEERGNRKESSPWDGISPTSPIYIFRPNPDLEIAFDTRTRNPVYVLERLASSNNVTSTGRNTPKLKRPSHFYEEKLLPEEFRSRASHYKHSGFDRGHLAAAGNYTDTTEEKLGHTFNLCNVSPQNHVMNATIWSQLERWTKAVADAQPDHYTTFVMSGPLWMPAKKTGEKLFEFHYNALGNPPSLLSVPTHFFKVVVVVDQSSSRTTTRNNDNPQEIIQYACFVVPNEEDPTGTRKRSLEQYLVPWTNLEAVTGLHFFPGLTNTAPAWKQQANALLQQVIPGGKGPLLLTDGSASASPKKWRWGKDKKLRLEHLCANGKCS